jgi:hypothetical protein
MVCAITKSRVFTINFLAFPVGGTHALQASVTLLNFGEYCKCTCLHFICNVADVNDKTTAEVCFCLGENLAILNEIATRKTIRLPKLKMELPCNLFIGGDDPLMRILLQIDSSLSKYCCKYCFQQRNCKRIINNHMRIIFF